MFTPPYYPGGAVPHRSSAIESGDTDTGVSIMAMEPGLDAGPVLLTRALPIDSGHTGGTLLDDLAQLGVTALIDSLENIDTLLATATPQDDSKATYANKISKQEGALDWSAAADALARQVASVSSGARLLHPPWRRQTQGVIRSCRR